MKSKWFALGCLTSFLIVIVIIFLSLSGLNKMGRELTGSKSHIKIAQNSYLHLRLSGPITAYNEYQEGFFGNTDISVHDLVQKIDFAAQDDNISGIFLEPNFISAGYADLNELSKALERFRVTGKEVISYLDFAFDKDYFLASSSDDIFLNPSSSAGIILTGIGGNVQFYKDLLEKIGIDIVVLSAGKYKGAGETFSRSSFSAPVKQNIQNVYDALYTTILETIARNRNLTYPEIKAIYEDRGELFINHNTALNYKLIDDLYYRDEVMNKYNLNNKLVDFKKYKAYRQQVSANKIAVVYTQGMIAPSATLPSGDNLNETKINPIFDDLMKDKTVKAVVLRINSPGGSALISENITQKINQLKSRKPVVVSMGNVAASGGYYISCRADYIYSDPFTVTGSIGVVAMLPNLQNLADKAGVRSEKIGNGKFTHFLDIYSKPSNEELTILQNSLQDTYLEFKKRVADGRSLSLEAVEEIAQGQVWSSNDAVEKRLADDIGMLSDAIYKAAELAELETFRTVFYPQKKSFLEELIKKGFDIDLAEQLIKNSIPDELEIKETIELYNNIKTQPIQAILPYRLQL